MSNPPKNRHDGWSGKPVLITGRKGIIGSNPAARLVDAGVWMGNSATERRRRALGMWSPEAAEGDEIGLIRNGDIISINLPEKRIEVKVSGHTRALAEGMKKACAAAGTTCGEVGRAFLDGGFWMTNTSMPLRPTLWHRILL